MDIREGRPVPASEGATLVAKPRFTCVPGRESVSFLFSFTSGIPESLRHDVWEKECSCSQIQGSVSPCRINHGGRQTGQAAGV
jgi:hypothetical protein